MVTTNDNSNYKKYTGKKRITTGKLSDHVVNSNSSFHFFFSYPMQVQHVVLFFAFHTSGQCLTVYHFTIKTAQFFAVALFIQYFMLSWTTGIKWIQMFIFHKSPQEKYYGGCGQTYPRATAHSKILLPHCKCVVALNHIAKHHLVCLPVPGALSVNPVCHRR